MKTKNTKTTKKVSGTVLKSSKTKSAKNSVGKEKKKSSEKVEKSSPKKTKSEIVKAVKKQAESKTIKPKFQAHSTALKVGEKAPYFEGLNQDSEKISLNDFQGKRLILYFYPKDNTPGCTAQACNLQENLNKLKKDGFEVVGVSADDVKSHKKFADKFKLEFNLLADVEKKTLKSYDVFGKKMFMGRIFDGIIRTSFVIGKNGIIEHIITGVDVSDHANQIRNLN